MRIKMFNIISSFFLFILFLLALIGLSTSGTVMHELIHWHDLKEIVNQETDSICLIDMPTEGFTWKSISEIHGTYYFFYNESVPDWQNKSIEIGKKAEFRAYGIEIAITASLFFLITTIVLWRWFSISLLEDEIDYYRRESVINSNQNVYKD